VTLKWYEYEGGRKIQDENLVVLLLRISSLSVLDEEAAARPL